MKVRELIFLAIMGSVALLTGCQKANALAVEVRARLMAEEVKPNEAQCIEIRSKFLKDTHSESELTLHYEEAKKLHCLHGDV